MSSGNTDSKIKMAGENEWQVVSIDVLREKYAKGSEHA